MQDEVEKLRSIREAEMEIDWQSQVLPSLQQEWEHLPDSTQDQELLVSWPCLSPEGGKKTLFCFE